jgi:hypothetical protein
MNAHQLFRLSLEEITRRTKRSELFRHPLFATAETDDPLEPAAPFVQQGLLPLIEAEWYFARDAVPDHIRLTTGGEARKRCLIKLAEEYGLPPAARFKRVQDAFKIKQYNAADPETWDTGYFCFISVTAEFSGIGIPLIWVGNRSNALTDPRIRPWFFNQRARVVHGEEAVNLARLTLSKARAPEPGGGLS